MVMAAVISQAAISSAGEPTVRLMSAETMKMPEPIIEPITMAVAEKRPMPRTKCGVADACSCGVVEGVTFPQFYRRRSPMATKRFYNHRFRDRSFWLATYLRHSQNAACGPSERP